jgi:hypothetical protein
MKSSKALVDYAIQTSAQKRIAVLTLVRAATATAATCAARGDGR